MGKSGEKTFFRLRFRLHFFLQLASGNFHNAFQGVAKILVASVFVRGESVEMWTWGDSFAEIDSFVGSGVCCHAQSLS